MNRANRDCQHCHMNPIAFVASNHVFTYVQHSCRYRALLDCYGSGLVIVILGGGSLSTSSCVSRTFRFRSSSSTPSLSRLVQTLRISSPSSSAVYIKRTLSSPRRRASPLSSWLSIASLSGRATESANCDIDENESCSEVMMDISCGVRELR